MNAEQLQALREKLIAACDAHLAKGGKIVSSYFVRGGKQENCCPVYALAGGITGGVDWALSDAVGFTVSHDEAWSFIHSFDGSSLSWLTTQGRMVQEMVDLGTELRAKYILSEGSGT